MPFSWFSKGVALCPDSRFALAFSIYEGFFLFFIFWRFSSLPWHFIFEVVDVLFSFSNWLNWLLEWYFFRLFPFSLMILTFFLGLIFCSGFSRWLKRFQSWWWYQLILTGNFHESTSKLSLIYLAFIYDHESKLIIHSIDAGFLFDL